MPSSVASCTLGNKQIYLIGTAHVSQKSVQDVRETIEAVNPDSVCVELCAPRHQALTDKEKWKKMNIFQVIRNGKAAFLLAQLIMTSFYQRIGDKLGVQPGAEMLEGIKLAEEKGKTIVLADRNVEITLKRVWRHLSFFDKFKMLAHVFTGILGQEEISEEEIEKLKEANEIESVMEMFAKTFPQVKERLIDERDIYLAQKIRHAPGNTIVAVVGAGHVPGILREITKETSLEPLEQIPPSSPIGKWIKWAIMLLIISIPIIAFLRGSFDQALSSMTVWGVSHSVLAGGGAAIAFGHPLAILTAIIASPFTSLVPVFATGWLVGLVQAWIKKPTVGDLEAVPQSIKTVSGFWKNPTTRILLVIALSNLGSSIATFLSGTWIISTIL